MRHRILWKLFSCFAAVLLLFTLLAGILFTFLFGKYTIAHHEEELLQKAQNIALTLEEQINSGAEPHSAFVEYFHTVDRLLPEELWLVDKGEHRISQGLGVHAVDYGALPDSAKQLLDDVFRGEAVSSQEFTPILSEPCLTLGVPICDSERNVIAALLVHASVAGINDAIHEGIHFLLTALIAAMCIALITSVLMSTIFLRPIRSMQIAANHMAEGDYTISTGVTSRDELGALAKDLDTLACRLDEASRESRKLEQLRKDFVSNVSHELRTPVTVLRSSLEALCDGVIEEPREVVEYHDSMLSETIHLQRMIGDLLELSRLQNPDYVMKFASLDLTQAIEDALRSANHIAAKKNISLACEVSGSDCVVYGDYGRIWQLILILLDNAIKFSPENSTVDLNLCSTASTCVITVSDSGPGVPEEELPYVFDRFYTSSATVNPQGTGLGLFIANQIAQRHNADIRMENKTGSGCRITVVFWKHRPGNNTM